MKETPHPSKLRGNQDENPYQVGMPCYALEEDQHACYSPRWVPAEIGKVYGTRGVRVRILSNEARWRKHIDQLRPRDVFDLNTCVTDCEQASGRHFARCCDDIVSFVHNSNIYNLLCVVTF